MTVAIAALLVALAVGGIGYQLASANITLDVNVGAATLAAYGTRQITATATTNGVASVRKILIVVAALATGVGACNTLQQNPPAATALQPDANNADLRFPYDAEVLVARGPNHSGR